MTHSARASPLKLKPKLERKTKSPSLTHAARSAISKTGDACDASQKQFMVLKSLLACLGVTHGDGSRACRGRRDGLDLPKLGGLACPAFDREADTTTR